MDDSLPVRSLLLPFYERLEALGEPDPEVLMLTLCGVASTVPASLFAQCAKCGTEADWDALVAALGLQGFDPAVANRFTSSFQALPAEFLQDLAELVPDKLRPSPELAEFLLAQLHKRRRPRGGYAIPAELASLVADIALSYHVKPNAALCAGANGDMLAIQVAPFTDTHFHLAGAGVGIAYKRCIHAASGGHYTIDHHITPSESEPGTRFHCGLLADTWGQSPFPTENTSKDPFLGYTDLLSEVRGLPDMLKRVDGRVVALVPMSWLLRTVGDDAVYKQVLINKGLIEAVIQLPERSVIGAGVACGLLVLNTNRRTDHIKFIDATGDAFSERDRLGTVSFTTEGRHELRHLIDSHTASDTLAVVDSDTVLRDGGSLDPRKHVHYGTDFADGSSFASAEPLEDLVDIIQCQAIKAWEEGSSDPDVAIARRETELGPSDIDSYGFLKVDADCKRFIPDLSARSRVERQRLKTGDIVFAVKGRVGLSAYVDEAASGCMGNQSFVILRIKPGVTTMDARILHHFLRSNRFASMIASRVKGTQVRIMKITDLRQFPIPVLDETQAARVIESWESIHDRVLRIREIESGISQDFNDLWQ